MGALRRRPLTDAANYGAPKVRVGAGAGGLE
jgi:hypothetical protein